MVQLFACRFRPAHCRHYTTKDKFLLLEKAGSRNQFYMADSPEEAAKNFAPLLPYPQDKTAEMFADQVQAVSRHIYILNAAENCELAGNRL